MDFGIPAGFIEKLAKPRYVLALLAVAGAVGLRLALDPLLGTQSPYLPLAAAVLVAGRLGGRGPALGATALGSLSAWYFFVEPRFSFTVTQPYDLVGLGLFGVIGVGISLLEAQDGAPSGTAAAGRWENRSGGPVGVPAVRRTAMLAGGALAIGILASLLWSGLTRSMEAERWVEHTYQVLNAVTSVGSSLEVAETSQRGYLLTGDDRYLKSYRAALAAEQAGSLALRRLTADSRVQQARLKDFDRLAQTRLAVLDSTIQVSRQQGLPAAIGVVRTDVGKELMDQLRAQLHAIEDEERGLLHRRTTEAGLADSRTRWILGLGSGSLVILLLLAGAALERHIYRLHQAEKLLARQARLIDLSHDAVITADGKRVITGWNTGAQQMYGWTAEEAAGKTIHELLHTSSNVAIAEIDRVLAGADRWEGELVHTRADGRQIVAESRQVLLREDAGVAAGYLEINRDITDRRRAEDALRESAKQFETLANGIPQLCWMANEDGWIFWYNERWYQYTGTTPKDMEGWGWQAVHDPQALPGVMERWQASLTSGEPFDMVFPLRGADGVFRPFLTRVMPVRDGDGKVVRWFGTNTDISEQRQTEEALRESRTKLEAALASMTDAVFISDAEGRFLHFNDAFATFHRFQSKADCHKNLGDYPAILEVSLPGGDPAPLEQWAVPRALRGETAINAEYILRRKDTGECWVGSYSFAPIRDAHGAIAGSVVVARDITGRKRAEEEIRRLNTDLEQRVLDRTAQLAASNKELEAFAYSVSHDLRAPLRGIDGWTLALLEDYCGACEKLEGKGRKYLDRVRSETQRMGHLIDDLLQLSRITRAEMHRGAVNLSATAESIAARLRESHPQRRLEFAIRPGLTAFGDARLLEVALTNLLQNAVKFTGPREQARIEFEAAECDGQPAFAIRDNGVGFDMAYAGTLFGAFQRLHNESEFPGTGIGLATVQRVIHRHGGRVWAQAEPDRGANFYFTVGPDR
ncbi:MAG TPA: PAS domain S-box protein [Bryobacteraceae bacterium]|nr:PAS domain S-box protein [Bryobacteraceae bacterium]